MLSKLSSMLFWMESLIRHYRALIRLKKPWINIITINRVVYGLKENRAQKNSKSTLSYLDIITLFSRIAEYVHNVISCRLRIRTYVIWKTTHLLISTDKNDVLNELTFRKFLSVNNFNSASEISIFPRLLPLRWGRGEDNLYGLEKHLLHWRFTMLRQVRVL